MVSWIITAHTRSVGEGNFHSLSVHRGGVTCLVPSPVGGTYPSFKSVGSGIGTCPVPSRRGTLTYVRVFLAIFFFLGQKNFFGGQNFFLTLAANPEVGAVGGRPLSVTQEDFLESLLSSHILLFQLNIIFFPELLPFLCFCILGKYYVKVGHRDAYRVRLNSAHEMAQWYRHAHCGITGRTEQLLKNMLATYLPGKVLQLT